MKKCKRCNVKVYENITICPLCRTVLTDIGGEVPGRTYPAIEVNQHKYNIVKRLFVFLSIISGLATVVTNYVTYSGVVWSAISVAAIIYFWIIMTYSIKRSTNIASKILVQVLCASILTVIMDYFIGYSGWSVNHVIPEIIILANISVLILVIINRMYWQTYILNQVIIAVFGLIPGILYLCGLIEVPLPTIIATGTSFTVLLGTIIFGDKSIKSELIRRFHF
ncbi:DUF6320 domain-containing protein [Ruminiclostridium cellobioparum]|uniref:Zinc ribbon domain-containing protein n=1 Tax=Ruminiclostridium cellobioparum subsp. termitidis CT1112 TaxID=1195236 RepID=S0FN11_RUMCE|nr:DUF6320 domain-containing protein [Ruminiclostridium cellobioparum]EMS69858.1 hypothetical protein CTER_4465 [Ruminiclostridium cellobioparum subsp. termitidis CT1112]